jgi:hypothetical protein
MSRTRDLPLLINASLLEPETSSGVAGRAGTASFQNDARLFLKRLANALGLKSGAYSIVTHSGTVASAGEIVLRADRLLVVFTQDDTRRTTVSCSAITPGHTTAPEAIETFDIHTLFTEQGQRQLLDSCRTILRPPAKTPPPGNSSPG